MSHRKWWVLVLFLTFLLISGGLFFVRLFPGTACMLGVLGVVAFVEFLRRMGVEDITADVNAISGLRNCPTCGVSLEGNVCYYDSYLCIDCEMGEKAKRS